MRTGLRIAAVIIGIGMGAPAADAQHEGHQQTTPSAPNAACTQGGQQALAIVETAGAQLDAARQTNSPADMRAAISQLQTALAAAQAQLAACRTTMPVKQPEATSPAPGGGKPGTTPSPPAASAPAMDPAAMGHGKSAPGGKPPAMGAKPPAPTQPMDHSKMGQGAPAPRTKAAAPGAKPAAPAHSMDHSKMPTGTSGQAAKPATPVAKPATPPQSMDHSKMPAGAGETKAGGHETMKTREPKLPVMPAERVMDPTCPNADTKTAPKATYERKVYYFCSDHEREEFVKDPAAYLKKRPRG